MKVGAFGEVMLRLTPPEYLLLEQTNNLKCEFTGTGVNILSNLSHFGLKSYLQTTLPNNRVGAAAKYKLRMLGIETDFVTSKGDHIGSYFAEMGYASRPTQVTYQNRLESSFGRSKAEDYDFEKLLQEIDLIHICGIALSLTEETYQSALLLAKTAVRQGKKVCFDFNFRPSLNTAPGKKDLMKKRYEQILPYCDIVFGSSRDLVELLRIQDKLPETSEDEKELANVFMEQYSISWFAGTERRTNEGNKAIAGFLYTTEGSYRSDFKKLEILDRIGAGDAYAAGVILAYLEKWPCEDAVEFAVANTLLAHTIQGDVPLITRDQVLQVLADPTVELVR